MSDSHYFDDTLDSEFLDQVDALETKQRPSTRVYTLNMSSHTSSQSLGTTNDASSARVRAPSRQNSDSYEEVLDLDDLEEIDDVMARGIPEPSNPQENLAPTASKTLQTTLWGGPAPESLMKNGATSRAQPTGERMRKVKTWDKTAFAKSGWKATRSSTKGDAKAKGKGRASFDEKVEGEEDVLLLEDFPDIPEYTSIKTATTMLLQPDRISIKEWIFPLNNPKRDYQFNIVKRCLFENCLVALPTGMGKTFIAGCVMLNYYRWFPEGKIVFAAPSKPLVSQQIEASHQTCGIPGYDAIELTGQIPKTKRAQYWQTKRVFYMTPQTLINDLITQTCDPQRIVLIVIDEAHKGTGDYAYAQIVRYMMAANPFHRVLALTATPGSTPDAVQAIIDSLHLSHIEIRDENSLDLRKYSHKKHTSQHIIKMTDSLLRIRDPLQRLMESVLQPLSGSGILHCRNVIQLQPYRCTATMQGLKSSQKWALVALKYLGALSRAMGYLMEMSVGMAYHTLQELVHGFDKDGKETAIKPQQSRILKDPHYISLMKEIERQRNQQGHFPMHPKMDKLRITAVQYFARAQMDEEDRVQAGGTPNPHTSTRMIIFCSYRECVEQIVEMLNGEQPLIRAHKFIGQGTDKRGGKGVTQREQLEVIEGFKDGKYNAIVATSIGEEGLDIGEVDIIVCYDAQKDPLRMLQRVGRTGRKRDGRVEVLLAEGREENNWHEAQVKYREVQKTIVRGDQLELYKDVPRLLPDGVKPTCIETVMEIIPYKREVAKRTNTSTSAGKKRKKEPDVGSMLKSGKGKKRSARDENEAADDLADTPPKKRAKFVYDSPTESKAATSKSKRKGSNKAPKRLKNEALPHIPLKDGFRSAKEMMDSFANEGTCSSEPESLSQIRNSIKRVHDGSSPLLDTEEEVSTLTSMTKTDAKPVFAHQKLASKPTTGGPLPQASEKSGGPVPRDHRSHVPSTSAKPNIRKHPSTSSNPTATGGHAEDRNMKWLMDSDSDTESLDTNAIPPKIALKPSAKFNEASPSPIIDLDDDDDGDDVHLAGKALIGVGQPAPESSTILLLSSSPALREAKSTSDDPNLSTSQPIIRRLKRRIEPDEASRLMPPPPRPAPETSSVVSPVVSRKKKSKPVHSLLNGHEFLEIEAEHSGDDIEAGSSDPEGVENEFDRQFAGDFDMSQVADDYDQPNVYRQSLFTQAPVNGPSFLDKPVRTGAFAGGRSWQRPVGIPHRSSSPRNEELNEYSFGSFVVHDDEELLYDTSSSQVEAETDII